jgi:hypothetical protein
VHFMDAARQAERLTVLKLSRDGRAEIIADDKDSLSAFDIEMTTDNCIIQFPFDSAN